MLLYPPLLRRDTTLSHDRDGTLAPGMYHAHIDNACDDGSASEVGNWKACPLVVSELAPVLPACVKLAVLQQLPPLHGPAACAAGETPETVNGPRGVGALSAKMLDESKV